MKRFLLLIAVMASVIFLAEAQSEKSKNKKSKTAVGKKNKPVAKRKITTFILTRHAEKDDDGTKNPNLSAVGIKRAFRLSKVLSMTKVDKVISTPYKRTMQTMKHVARDAEVEIEPYDYKDKDLLKNLLKKSKGQTIVISGHSNTTPALVNKLIGTEKYQQLEENDYDKIFIVSCTRIGNCSEVVIEY
ncbi:MAG: histidine phosphatase family protein [Cyclobacteriaceae bacterium]